MTMFAAGAMLLATASVAHAGTTASRSTPASTASAAHQAPALVVKQDNKKSSKQATREKTRKHATRRAPSESADDELVVRPALFFSFVNARVILHV